MRRENQPQEQVAAGIFWMLATMFFFVSLDAAMKYILHDYSLVQAVWARFTFALGFGLAATARHWRAALVSRRPGIQTARSILLALTTVLFNAGIITTPLATASCIMFLTPLLVTMLARPVLGEVVGLRRWIGIAAGFTGAVIIVRPEGAGLGPGVLLLLAAAFANASYQLTTRKLHNHDGPLTSFIYTPLAGAVVSSFIVPWHWQAPDARGWALLVLVGVLGAVGHLCLIHAFRKAPASAVAPFSYSSLVWAVLLGWLVFGEWPDAITFLGAVVIVGSGLYVFRAERPQAADSAAA